MVAVVALVLWDVAWGAAAGWAAGRATGLATRRLRVVAGLCLATLVAATAEVALLTRAHTAASQTALLVPAVTSLLALLPACGVALAVVKQARPS
jgi:hypothetical protein